MAADYAFAFDRLADFYSGNPQQREAWSATVQAVQAAPVRATATLAGLVGAQLAARNAPAAAREAAATFADPRTVAVLTGQQAGLFGGPLYTVHKALTALKLARRIGAEHDVPAVAVFWIDSEDHDWEEIRRTVVLDEAHAPQTITLADVAGAGERPIARLTLDDGVSSAIDQLAGTVAATEFTAELVALLRETYTPGRGVAEAFACLLDRVLGPLGLVVYDAADPTMKPLVRDLFVKAIADPGRTTALARTAGEGLERLGYHAQVTPADQTLPLFAIDGHREAIRWHGSSAAISGEELPLERLAARAADAPEGFSPNVLLRPLVQDSIFPTVCYVGGPSELAYLGQLRALYGHFGLPMPIVVPRASASIADSATIRFLTRYDTLAFSDLQRQDEHTLNELLESQLPPAVEQSFHRAGAAIVETLGAVTEAARQVDATLEGAAKSTLGKLQHDLDALHGKVVHAAKRKDETLRRQFTRAQTLLFPNGEPQERELGMAWLLNRYGPAAIDRLLEVLPIEAGHHWVLAI